MTLESELATYREKLPGLLQHEGKYVLIHARDVAGVFSSYEDALRQGYREFGLSPFLVKQIQTTEQVQFVTRAVLPVHAS
ncbi:MAG TPA: hypothetical protein VNP72_02715 [Longimicrobium sp.]|nr:hypothetical protein [Longimicrobium sp.]